MGRVKLHWTQGNQPAPRRHLALKKNWLLMHAGLEKDAAQKMHVRPTEAAQVDTLHSKNIYVQFYMSIRSSDKDATFRSLCPQVKSPSTRMHLEQHVILKHLVCLNLEYLVLSFFSKNHFAQDKIKCRSPKQKHKHLNDLRHLAEKASQLRVIHR